MLKKFLFLIVAVASLTACGQQPADQTKATGEPQSFGEAITADGAIEYAALLPKMQGVDSMAVKVKGKVTGVCQAKGCWMNITDEASGKEMFVKFKDYGFFMPKDIAGREVIMEGYAFREITPVEELRHYAEDEGKSKEEIDAITEPKEEMKFMASGVLLLPENKH
ncbi:MAG: DUF4920 domain-containing protein [Lewinellaceae bacterium]|nr:DUF4920 domain-containing protein [Saprospiraceae bacterium]MCB9337987.1 DUF4920 domain-containing protein [Lewinellaceae bacterium]